MRDRKVEHPRCAGEDWEQPGTADEALTCGFGQWKMFPPVYAARGDEHQPGEENWRVEIVLNRYRATGASRTLSGEFKSTKSTCEAFEITECFCSF